MNTAAFRIRSLLPALLCLMLCGCPTPDGGDRAVWQDHSVKGTAEILAVTGVGNPATTNISFRFTYDWGHVEEEPLEGLPLASIVDLPGGYVPKVGDKIELQIDVHCKRKLSVGPPNFLHSGVDKRTFTCLNVTESEEGKTAAADPPAEKNDPLMTSAEESESQPLSMSTVSNLDDQASTDPKPAKQLNDTVVVPPDPFSDSSTNANASQSKDIKANANPETELGAIDHLIWTMNGRGDLEFRLRAAGDTFDVQVNRYLNQAQIAKFNLSVDDGAAFELVQAIFNKQRDLNADTFTPVDAARTAMSITLVDDSGHQKQWDDLRPDGELRPVYDFVVKAVKKSKPPAASTHPYQVDKLNWDTNGGGSLHFSVTPDQDQFKIHVTDYHFKVSPLDLFLTADDGTVYATVKSIFDKQRDLQKDTFTPEGLTGTWTTITLLDLDQNKTEFKNISASGGELREVYDFVANAASKSQGEEPLPEPDYGTDK